MGIEKHITMRDIGHSCSVNKTRKTNREQQKTSFLEGETYRADNKMGKLSFEGCWWCCTMISGSGAICD